MWLSYDSSMSIVIPNCKYLDDKVKSKTARLCPLPYVLSHLNIGEFLSLMLLAALVLIKASMNNVETISSTLLPVSLNATKNVQVPSNSCMNAILRGI